MISRNINKGEPVRLEKLLYEGKAELTKVYRIDIDSLYYNDNNGRIATYMAEYNANHPDQKISDLDFDEYNDIIMDFIKNSGSKDKYKMTKEDIRENGQLKTGIILDDGRIIDGNRRFTCLRELYRETSSEKYKFFECFVLPVPKNEQDRKKIKSLEIKYQFGEDSKEDYNAIDRLVDIYINLVGPKKIFTPEEYYDRMNKKGKLSEIKLAMKKAEIMHDYLDFIGESERYDIARDMKLDGPIQEIANFRKSLTDEDEWNQVSSILYLFMKESTGDKTREIRGLINLYKNKYSEYQAVEERLTNLQMMTFATTVNQDTTQPEAQEILKQQTEEFKSYVKDAVKQTQKEMAQKKQNDILESAIKKLNEIDTVCLKMLPADVLNKFKQNLNQLKRQIEKFEKELSNANRL